MAGNTLQRAAVMDDAIILNEDESVKLRGSDSCHRRFETQAEGVIEPLATPKNYAVVWMREPEKDENQRAIVFPPERKSDYIRGNDGGVSKRMNILLGEDAMDIISYQITGFEKLGVKIRPTDSNRKSWQSFAVAIGAADGAWIASDQAFGIANYSAEGTFNSQWELYSNLDTLFTLAVPGAASLILLGYRYYKNGELVLADGVAAGGLGTKMAGAVSGWSFGNNIAEILLGWTGASSVKAGELIGNIAIGEVIAQTLGQALLIGGCAAAGLTFANFLFTTLAAGVEEAIKNDPQQSNKSNFAAFWEGFGRAAKEFIYNKDNYKLMGAGFVGAIVWFAVDLAVSALVVSGVLTGGAALIVAPMVALLIAGVVNYCVFYKIAKPTTDVEKMAANGVFSNKPDVSAANGTAASFLPSRLNTSGSDLVSGSDPDPDPDSLVNLGI